MAIKLNCPLPSKPEQYLHLYVDIVATREEWKKPKYGYTKESDDLQYWFPDMADKNGNVGKNDEEGTFILGCNIPQELINIATSKCPFLGAQVALMFKELGIYVQTPQSSA